MFEMRAENFHFKNFLQLLIFLMVYSFTYVFDILCIYSYTHDQRQRRRREDRKAICAPRVYYYFQKNEYKVLYMGSKSPSFVVVKVSKEPLLSQIGCRWQKKHSQLSRAEKLRTRTNEQRGREREGVRERKKYF